MTIQFKPMGKRVLLEEINTVSAGGIIIPDEVETVTQRRGKIVAMPEDSEVHKELKMGDIVFYERIAVDMALEGKDYKLVHLEYIQGLQL